MPVLTNRLPKTSLYFWLFLFAHVLLWTLGPYWARHSLPHDTLEGITWGLQWQWGYNKHPFLTAWLSAGMVRLLGNGDWPVYLLAQTAVALTFIAVWQLAKKILHPQQALIAALLLEGVLFYNINSFNLTPDTLQSPLWAFLSLFFYQALVTQKRPYWLLTGFFAALCLCTKYQAIVLFAPMLIFCLWNARARSSFKKSGIYWALAVFFLVISPHVLWLYQHDFITLTYARTIASEYTETDSLLNHIMYPALFLGNGLFAVSGVFILLWPFYFRSFAKLAIGRGQWLIQPFQWQFLIAQGLGPFLLSLLLCMINGDYFPPRWATPYFFLIGIMSMCYFKPRLSSKQTKLFTITFILFSSLLFFIRITSLTLIPRADSDAFLPNQEIAHSLEKIWHEHYHTPLAYLAGSNYLVAMTTPYFQDKPQPYLSWIKNENPWISETDLRKKGALFIWDEGEHYVWDNDSKTYAHPPPTVLRLFPKLIILPNAVFYRTSDQQKITIGVGLLPPTD